MSLKKSNLVCKTVNTLWRLSCFYKNKQYNNALSNCEEVQKRYLFRLLKNNAKSIYGKKWGFADISSLKQFQEKIPLTEYMDYVSYIDIISKGEKNVFTSEDVLLFEPSSGSASPQKLIPYTKSLRREFQNAIAPWIFSLYGQIPELTEGRAYWAISPNIRRKEWHGAIPIGFDNDAAYLGFTGRYLFPLVSVEPKQLDSFNNIAEFRSQTLASLLSAEDLTLISVWSPSFLRILLDWYFEHDNEIFGLMKKNGDRGSWQRVGDLKKMGKDKTVFERIWPHLKVISCWTDGASRNEALRLKQYFSNTYIQGKGLVSTEAFVSFPYMAGYDPVLASTSHFFEFMNENGDCLLAHQVKKNCEYSVIVTTGGGLYRYRLGDRVLVTGFLGDTPTLRFLGKSENISDKYGEKVNELHVSKILKSILGNCEYNFCMLAPDSKANENFYTLYIEFDGVLPENVRDLLEQGLRENFHYRYCIELGQLSPVRIFRVRNDGYKTYEARCLDRGMKQGDIKLAYLSAQDGWSNYFHGDYK